MSEYSTSTNTQNWMGTTNYNFGISLSDGCFFPVFLSGGPREGTSAERFLGEGSCV
jgi:hypothetical protein